LRTSIAGSHFQSTAVRSVGYFSTRCLPTSTLLAPYLDGPVLSLETWNDLDPATSDSTYTLHDPIPGDARNLVSRCVHQDGPLPNSAMSLP